MTDLNRWLKEAKEEASAKECGMYLIHNGVVRASAKKSVREGLSAPPVAAMDFSFDKDKIQNAVKNAEKMPGIRCVRISLNSGHLNIGDDLMYILVGGDIRPNVVSCLEKLLDEIKTSCVTEKEIY